MPLAEPHPRNTLAPPRSHLLTQHPSTPPEPNSRQPRTPLLPPPEHLPASFFFPHPTSTVPPSSSTPSCCSCEQPLVHSVPTRPPPANPNSPNPLPPLSFSFLAAAISNPQTHLPPSLLRAAAEPSLSLPPHATSVLLSSSSSSVAADHTSPNPTPANPNSSLSLSFLPQPRTPNPNPNISSLFSLSSLHRSQTDPAPPSSLSPLHCNPHTLTPLSLLSLLLQPQPPPYHLSPSFSALGRAHPPPAISPFFQS